MHSLWLPWVVHKLPVLYWISFAKLAAILLHCCNSWNSHARKTPGYPSCCFALLQNPSRRVCNVAKAQLRIERARWNWLCKFSTLQRPRRYAQKFAKSSSSFQSERANSAEPLKTLQNCAVFWKSPRSERYSALLHKMEKIFDVMWLKIIHDEENLTFKYWIVIAQFIDSVREYWSKYFNFEPFPADILSQFVK